MPSVAMHDAPRRSARESKDAIVDASVRSFSELGYHGTSIRDIATGAEMTPASIYHHFPSKQRILQHIMEKVLEDVISRTTAALMDSGRSPSAQLDAVVRAWVLYHTDNRAQALIGASEIRSLDEVGHRIVVSLRDRQQQLLLGVIERGVDEGDFTTPYPAQATMAILNMGSAIATWYRPNGDLTADQLAERYSALALGTVGALRSKGLRP